MENFDLPILNGNDVKQRSIFTINTINDTVQVVFITDLDTGKKLDDDYNVNEYISAVAKAELLGSHGVTDPQQIDTITRSEEIDDNKVPAVIALDVVPNVQDGVDELRCSIVEDGYETHEKSESFSMREQRVSMFSWKHLSLYSESEEHYISEESPVWGQQVREAPESVYHLAEIVQGPTLRWNQEMTTQLIKVRGDMDSEFVKAKYKFRLWEVVAVKLNEILVNVKVTAKDCDDKWRNIVATYRKNIDKMKCCGDNTIRWEYFNAMDNILKGTKELLASDPFPNSVSEETMTNLLCSLDPLEVDVINQPSDLISISDDSSPVEEIEIDDLDEVLQDCIITRKLNGEKRKWTTEQCLMLLHLRKQMENKFLKSYDKAPSLWREIASQMNINFLSDFTASESESVWNHCNINYEINLENLKSKGVDTVNWKYFAIMDELRGGTREIAELCVPRPGESLLSEFQQFSHKYPSLLPQFDNAECTSRDETDCEDGSRCLSGVVWTQEMVKVLISFKKMVDQDIVKHKVKRTKQWTSMAQRFRGLKYLNVTAEACEEKWRNLVRTYKKNLDRARKKGTGVIRWQYFWRMHELLGHSVFENERQSACSSVNKTGIVKSVDVPSSKQFLIGDQEETMLGFESDDLSTMVNGSKDKPNQMLHEVISRQNEKIEELHREQLKIKSLLTQLLEKFS